MECEKFADDNNVDKQAPEENKGIHLLVVCPPLPPLVIDLFGVPLQGTSLYEVIPRGGLAGGTLSL